MDRYRLALKKWLPYSLIGAAISLVTALVLHASFGKIIVAIFLTIVLIFGGFVLRSFGKGKGEEGESGTKSFENNR